MQENLTKDAVIFLSSGNYDQPVVMQVYNVRKISPLSNELFLCLTDGHISTGARFKNNDNITIENYWLVKILVEYLTCEKPINILSLQVISTFPNRMFGDAPITLKEHFARELKRNQIPKTQTHKYQREISQREITQREVTHKYQREVTHKHQREITHKNEKQISKNQREQPVKRVKPNEPIMVDNNSSNQKSVSKKAKIESVDTNNLVSTVSTKFMPRKLQLVQQEEEPEKQDLTERSPNIKSEEKSNPMKLPHKSYIRELSEEDNDWVILCKVTYIYKVQCTGGNQALNFLIMDEKGDEVQCVCYGSNAERYQQYLERDKYYEFSGGFLSDNRKGDLSNCRELQITFDRPSKIVFQPDGNFQFDPSRVCRIDHLLHKANNDEINVIGIVKNLRPGEKQPNKNKIRYSVTLCDPTSNSEIEFGVFVNQNEEFKSIGKVCLFHNFRVEKKGSVVKLQSGFRSYYSDGSEIKGSLVESFNNYIESQKWDNKKYQTLNSATLTRRNIKELIGALNSTDDPKLFSIVDCWITAITIRNSFTACSNCKKSTYVRQQSAFCSKCNGSVQTFLCYTFEVLCSDFTSSLKFDIMGQHAEALLEMKVNQFDRLSKEDKKGFLESLKFKNVGMRFKSEIKKDKGLEGLYHSVWGIDKVEARPILTQIDQEMHRKDTW